MGSPLVLSDLPVRMVRVQTGWGHGYTHASAFLRQLLQVSGRDPAVKECVVEQCVKLLQCALWYFKYSLDRVADNAEEEQACRRLCDTYPSKRGRIHNSKKLKARLSDSCEAYDCATGG